MRNWKSVALGSACLLAVGCGSNEGETARADVESQSGGESVSGGATSDPYVAYESETVGVEGDVATSEVIESDDALDTYSGMTDQPTGDREMTGSGIGSTEPLDEDRMAQGTIPPDDFEEPMDQPMGEEPMDQPMGEEPMALTAEDVCPADIEGLNVRASTIPRGGALIFTVAREQVQELRDRLNTFAELHVQHHQGAHGSTGMTPQEPGMGSTDAPGAGASGSIGAGGASGSMDTGTQTAEFIDEQALIHQASQVRVIDTPRGARLEIRLDEPDRVRDLRAELREDAAMLRDGRCPLALQIAS